MHHFPSFTETTRDILNIKIKRQVHMSGKYFFHM